MNKQLYSLVFLRSETEILLGLKKRGFGKGKWNGFGGKIEPGETIMQGAIREVQEECGLTPTNLRRIGLLEFEFEADVNVMEVHVFETYTYHGQLTETEEMQPMWFDNKSIPFNSMWADDAYWFPYMLKNEPFKGYFFYRGTDSILTYKLEELDLSEYKNEK